MTARPPEGGDEGFALAEVLVAFAILALVTLAMMRAFAGTTQTLGAASARETRIDLAQRVAERAAVEPIATGRAGGEEDRLVWWTELEPVTGAGLAPPAGTPRLFRLRVGVGPKDAWQPPPAVLTTLILGRSADGT